MRVVVTGGRDWDKRFPDRAAAERAFLGEMTWQVVAWRPVYGEVTAVAHGGATGADAMADWWAREVARVVPDVFPVTKAEWYPNGRMWPLDRSAGPRRNGRMLREFKPDVVFAFRGNSGTADCCRQAVAMGIRVVEVEK